MFLGQQQQWLWYGTTKKEKKKEFHDADLPFLVTQNKGCQEDVSSDKEEKSANVVDVKKKEFY